MSYLTEPLDTKHSRDSFSCGKDLLDNYFWTQAKQDVKRKLSACFVLVDNETGKISLEEYFEELMNSKISISPFGLGEITVFIFIFILYNNL